MELKSHPNNPDSSEVTYDNYREYIELRAMTISAFSGWVLRGLHLRPPMQFPYTETINNSRLEHNAQQLRKDAQFVLDKALPNAARISVFRLNLAESIESHFGQVM